MAVVTHVHLASTSDMPGTVLSISGAYHSLWSSQPFQEGGELPPQFTDETVEALGKSVTCFEATQWWQWNSARQAPSRARLFISALSQGFSPSLHPTTNSQVGMISGPYRNTPDFLRFLSLLTLHNLLLLKLLLWHQANYMFETGACVFYFHSTCAATKMWTKGNEPGESYMQKWLN